MIEHWATIFRLLCLGGCVVAFWMLASARFREWHNWNSKTKQHWLSLVGWVFYGFYSSIENILTSVPGGSRLIVQGVIIALTLRALANSKELRSHSSVPWKGDHKDEA